jgi:hypothetical protein
MRPWEVARLTPFQVKWIYGHERDRDGKVVPTGPPGRPPITEKELWLIRCELIGVPKWRAEKEWVSRAKST